MKPFGVAEWYPILTRGKDLTFVGDWTLYPTKDQAVELIRCSGEMVRAEVEADGVCRVRTTEDVLPLPVEVVDMVRELLSLN